MQPLQLLSLTCKMRNIRNFRVQITPLLMIFLITVYFINSLSDRLQVSPSTLSLNDAANAFGWLLLVITILMAHRVTPLFAHVSDRIPRRLLTVVMAILGVVSTHLLVWPRAGIEIAIAAIVLGAGFLLLVRVKNRIAIFIFRALALAGVVIAVIYAVRAM
ncbi:MAG: hypothetical protein KatS3mg053_0653 [Candidatus Roseilinea sp.]|nr:MAG: hypothetical protein KatS3mg053_0653 [Candidatus Roseilinea sp.]